MSSISLGEESDTKSLNESNSAPSSPVSVAAARDVASHDVDSRDTHDGVPCETTDASAETTTAAANGPELVRIVKDEEDLKTLDERLNKIEHESAERLGEQLRADLEKSEHDDHSESISLGSDNEPDEVDERSQDSDSKTDDEPDQKDSRMPNPATAAMEMIRKLEANSLTVNIHCDLDEIPINSDKHKRAVQLLKSPLMIPQTCVEIEERVPITDIEHKYATMDSLIEAITDFEGYSWKNPVNESLLHTPIEVLACLKRMDSIYDFHFSQHMGAFSIGEKLELVFELLKRESSLPDIVFEHSLINSILGKIEVLLNTERNIWLKSSTITVDASHLTMFGDELKQMKSIQSKADGHHVEHSWSTFIDNLFGKVNKEICFDITQRGYRTLNDALKYAYCYVNAQHTVSYIMEELLGNTLKMYGIPVVQPMFFAIRTVYILARLVSIYIQKYKAEDVQTIADDLKTIAMFAISTYENKYQQWRTTAKPTTLLTNGDQLSIQSQYFVNNYILCGGQYFLLKAIEKALPVIAYDLK